MVLFTYGSSSMQQLLIEGRTAQANERLVWKSRPFEKQVICVVLF